MPRTRGNDHHHRVHCPAAKAPLPGPDPHTHRPRAQGEATSPHQGDSCTAETDSMAEDPVVSSMRSHTTGSGRAIPNGMFAISGGLPLPQCLFHRGAPWHRSVEEELSLLKLGEESGDGVG
jgi:hypothetical protein